MNKQQRNYIKAKAHYEAVKAEIEKLEIEYVKSLDIINEDGSTPKLTWMIDDDEKADAAIDAFGLIVENNGMNDRYNKAYETFKMAENDLVEWALSIIPMAREREILRRNAGIWKYREKIIDAAIKVDTKTIH